MRKFAPLLWILALTFSIARTAAVPMTYLLESISPGFEEMRGVFTLDVGSDLGVYFSSATSGSTTYLSTGETVPWAVVAFDVREGGLPGLSVYHPPGQSGRGWGFLALEGFLIPPGASAELEWQHLLLQVSDGVHENLKITVLGAAGVPDCGPPLSLVAITFIGMVMVRRKSRLSVLA